MTLIFAITTGILAILVIGLWMRLRKRSQHLSYIHQKISAILDQGTFERLLVFNSDEQVSQLLKDMNQLLDHAHRAKAIIRIRRRKCAICFPTFHMT